ncbi:hypothetical protein AURDEDRAFT_137120 [Auricularia subglabra TFB-10046 SS5]|nr:hypothetical protein AURDEDRAFT_137120 [Auricularia subglabra TFB-10046 SS5]
MSLANLLFKPKSADSELDSIFKSTPLEDDEAVKTTSRKRAKHDKQARKRVAEADSSGDEHAAPVTSKKKAVKHEKPKKKLAKPESDSEDDASAPAQASPSSSGSDAAAAQPSSESESDDDDDGDALPPKHISLSAGGSARQDGGKTKVKKAQHTPLDESSEQRDARTVFVGNLPLEVAKNRSARKQLIRHLTSLVPDSKVESIRFRSVAFQNPTSEMPKSDDEDDAAQKRRQKKREEELSVKEKRHKERAAAWREDQDQEPNDGKKQYLTPAEKKKIAFIHKEFHSDADTTNAYAVFAYPKPDSEGVTLAPDEAARLCVEKGDGSTFMERTIRVDRVGAGVASAKTDARRSIFVGNLDFAAKEEDLRVFFESLLTTERGAPSAPEGQEAEQTRWVTHVRLVRDAATQLGKGFAYVEFADRECVDEVLALDQVRLKFAKRKLRVQKCKVAPSSASVKSKHNPPTTTTTTTTKPGSSKKPILDPSHFVSAPKKSSTEYAARAAELATLPKDARKAAKAADADRLARRMEKKQKKRMALGAGAAEAAAGKGGKGILGKKKTAGGAVKPKPKAAKGRIRSEKSMAKRNAKK